MWYFITAKSGIIDKRFWYTTWLLVLCFQLKFCTKSYYIRSSEAKEIVPHDKSTAHLGRNKTEFSLFEEKTIYKENNEIKF